VREPESERERDISKVGVRNLRNFLAFA